MAIKSFKDRETEKVFKREKTRRVGHDVARAALRKLLLVHTATQLDDLKSPPGNHLEALKGDRQGQHSVRVNDQFRICFTWRDGNATDVELVDYH